MRDSIINDKAFRFAIRIVGVCRGLVEEKKEYVLSKQMLRSGTSIGANTREALEAQSKKDFVSKNSIALKEAVETEYWIELLRETGYIEHNCSQELLRELKEIIKILNKIIKTTKENMQM